MSILAKLLQTKNDNDLDTGQIPPGLLQTVARSGATESKRGLYLLIMFGSLAAVLLGYFMVNYLRSRSTSSATVTSAPPPVKIAATPVAPVHAVVSSARILPPVSKPADESATRKKPDEPVGMVMEHKKSLPVIRNIRTVKGVDAPPRSGKLASAPPGLKSLPKKDRLTIDAYLFAARNAEARRDYLLAMRQYLKAQEADPTNYRIMNNLASTFLQLGLNDEALSFAVKALAQKGDYVSALVNAGISHGKLGNSAAARGMLTKAVSLEPGNPQALFNLALTLERSGITDEAITTYRRLANGGDSRGYLGMARIQEKKGNTGEALQLYRDILALPEGGSVARELARKRISQLE